MAALTRSPTETPDKFKPGDLVLAMATVKSKPWPAKVLFRVEVQEDPIDQLEAYQIQFFGTSQTKIVKADRIFMYDQRHQCKFFKPINNDCWEKAMQEIQQKVDIGDEGPIPKTTVKSSQTFKTNEGSAELIVEEDDEVVILAVFEKLGKNTNVYDQIPNGDSVNMGPETNMVCNSRLNISPKNVELKIPRVPKNKFYRKTSPSVDSSVKPGTEGSKTEKPRNKPSPASNSFNKSRCANTTDSTQPVSDIEPLYNTVPMSDRKIKTKEFEASILALSSDNTSDNNCASEESVAMYAKRDLNSPPAGNPPSSVFISKQPKRVPPSKVECGKKKAGHQPKSPKKSKLASTTNAHSTYLASGPGIKTVRTSGRKIKIKRFTGFEVNLPTLSRTETSSSPCSSKATKTMNIVEELCLSNKPPAKPHKDCETPTPGTKPVSQKKESTPWPRIESGKGKRALSCRKAIKYSRNSVDVMKLLPLLRRPMFKPTDRIGIRRKSCGRKSKLDVLGASVGKTDSKVSDKSLSGLNVTASIAEKNEKVKDTSNQDSWYAKGELLNLRQGDGEPLVRLNDTAPEFEPDSAQYEEYAEYMDQLVKGVEEGERERCDPRFEEAQDSIKEILENGVNFDPLELLKEYKKSPLLIDLEPERSTSPVCIDLDP